MKLIEELLAGGQLRAGSIDPKDMHRILPWSGTAAEIAQRIEREWSKLEGKPGCWDIVWFAAP